VHGLEDVHVNRVACGSSHSIAWTTFNMQLPSIHEPVLFVSSSDPLGASTLGNSICVFSDSTYANVFMIMKKVSYFSVTENKTCPNKEVDYS
jgi:hypothetical protein